MSDKHLSMSDEDFLKLNEPPVVEAPAQETPAAAVVETPPAQPQEPVDTPAAEVNTPAVETPPSKDTKEGDTVTPVVDGEQTDKPETNSQNPSSGQEDKGSSDADTKKDVPPGSKVEGEASTPDYQGFYQKIMAPLKANGKTIELKDPEEAIQLMRMGANYTRKMQALAPQRKILMMLENSGMLDEAQISFAIDLVKKDPEAIKKLLADSKIDPLDIDIKSAPTYREGNHRVSDEEASFVTTLEDVQSTPEGTQTIQVINTQWDQASKEVLWKSPEIMQVIHEQRSSGVYDRVAAEVERQKTLGIISAKVPFLSAYKAVGDHLTQSGALNDLLVKTPSTPKPQVPVAQTKIEPKPAIKNGDKASAAAATRSTPKTADTKVNPLSLSDEAFMKQMADRL